MPHTDCLLILSFLFVSTALILSILFLPLVYYHIGNYFTYAQVKQPELKGLRLNDPELATELVFKGIKAISNMAFLGPDDILFLERLEGKVMRIVDGRLLPEPLLDVEVANNDGLLGIAIAKNANRPTYVFLYYTESKTDGGERLGNRLYRYELHDNSLANPKLLLNLPVNPGPMHHGGELIIGPDNNLYIAVGDIDGWRNETTRTVVQNYDAGISPDGRAGILRVTQDGEIVGEGILGNGHPLDMYYAYGLRNSFGMDFDPVTGILWDTENGPDFGDEVNLVEPGFNSGGDVISGKLIDKYQSQELVNFEKKGKYSDPEFSWGTEENKFTVAPTALVFFDSKKLGSTYYNDLFVGDSNNGNLYHFELNAERTELVLNGTLRDNVAVNSSELKAITLGEGFRGITDLQVGPDGLLYIVCQLERNQGAILKIYPIES